MLLISNIFNEFGRQAVISDGDVPSFTHVKDVQIVKVTDKDRTSLDLLFLLICMMSLWMLTKMSTTCREHPL
jgi:hypothetical protein